MEAVTNTLWIWTSLVIDTFWTWVGQVQSVQGGIAVAVVVLVFLNQRLAKLTESALSVEHLRTIPKKWGFGLLMVWLGWVFMMTTHQRIDSAERNEEDPTHAGQLVQFKSEQDSHRTTLDEINSLNGQLKDLRGDLDRLASDNDRLRDQLADARANRPIEVQIGAQPAEEPRIGWGRTYPIQWDESERRITVRFGLKNQSVSLRARARMVANLSLDGKVIQTAPRTLTFAPSQEFTLTMTQVLSADVGAIEWTGRMARFGVVVSVTMLTDDDTSVATIGLAARIIPESKSMDIIQ